MEPFAAILIAHGARHMGLVRSLSKRKLWNSRPKAKSTEDVLSMGLAS